MKRTVLALLVILLMIVACGCAKQKGGEDIKESLTNNMVRYMNEKYPDDTFTYKSMFGGGEGEDTTSIVVSSKNYPDADIYVHYSFGERDVFTDNYLGVMYADQTETVIRNIFDVLIDHDYLLFYEADRFACPNTTGEIDFKEYVASKESCIGFTVVVDGLAQNKEGFENALKTAVADSEICCSATIYFDDDSGEFDELKTKGLSGYTFKKLYSDVFSFEMSDSKVFSSSRWGD